MTDVAQETCDHKADTGCCPRFETPEIEALDNHVVTWTDKPFIKDYCYTAFYFPFRISSAFARLFDRQAELLGVPKMCSEHTNLMRKYNLKSFMRIPSMWYTEVLFDLPEHVDVPDDDTAEHITGQYFVALFTGPYKQTGEFINGAVARACERGHDVDKSKQPMIFYPYCPTCAETYNGNLTFVYVPLQQQQQQQAAVDDDAAAAAAAAQQ